MKYIALLLIVSSFFLVSCFEKKDGTTEVEMTQENPTLSEDVVWNNDFLIEDEPLNNTGVENTDDTWSITNSSNTSSVASTNVAASGGTKTDDAVIQEYEEDLEALFDDILNDK